jgi:DNA-binding PadR family transcriptional regulator
MSINHAILGFLSWSPLTGYDLKKKFAESDILYWSGNNNQIYRALVELHQQDFVTQEIHDQASGPSRKVYTITEKGSTELRRWLLSTPELPQLRNSFLVQLAWADRLETNELDSLLAAYEEEIRIKLLMLHEQNERRNDAPCRTPREIYLWEMITRNILSFYESQLAWVRQLRTELSEER